MRIRVANYISEFLVNHGINTCFMITGGGAMHLNDALGHQQGVHCLYNHHEQACAIAAESYARINNKMAAVCVTTGPGGTNAITGVVGGWLDSIPMLIISGQVRYDTTARSTGLNLRAMGDQEFDICQAVSSMTKYCEMVTDPGQIRKALERAYHEATTGRPGPCWLDIPLNVQGAYIETEELLGYDSAAFDTTLPPPPSEELLETIVEKIRHAKRPVLNAGSAIRLSGGYDVFQKLVEKLNIPVVTGWNSIDLMSDDHSLYVGRSGIMGDRAGNFAIQNSDLVLSIGSRLSIRQVGYNWTAWAKDAFVIANDIDKDELRKPTLHVDIPVWADAKAFMEKLLDYLPDDVLFHDNGWLECCSTWKERYPVVQEKHYKQQGRVNVYAFVHALSSSLSEGQVTVVGNGSACVVGSHAYVIKPRQRFIINSAIASMGYDLPAAIGACVAIGRKDVVNLTGDGSLQMNIQELATISFNKLPVKIFVINNGGYHSIRQTQSNYFAPPLVGVGEDSGDLGFPRLSSIATAYGLDYFSIEENEGLQEQVNEILSKSGPFICEVFVDKEQKFEPKVAARKLADGSMVSATLDNMAPFLSDEENAEIREMALAIGRE